MSRSHALLLHGRQAFATRDRAAWTALARSVAASGASPGTLDRALDVVDDLRRWGIPDDVLERTVQGATGSGWDPACEAFCRQRGLPINFHLGPMRAIEGAPLQDGMLVLERLAWSDEVVGALERSADAIGRRTFGIPCVFRERHVEFYDLALAVGPFATSGARYAAMFAPAYLGAAFAPEQHQLLRRSVLLHNVFRGRFDAVTVAAASRLSIDGRAPAFVAASSSRVDRAIALWLCLHEMLHASGPLPLFGARVRKLPLGLDYAAVEEMRADMTAWLVATTLPELLPGDADIVADVILAERLLRSARTAMREPAARIVASDCDGEHGALWLAVLGSAGALELDATGGITVDAAKMRAAIVSVLHELYEIEAEAASASTPQIGARLLLHHAAGLRARLFSRRDRGAHELVPAFGEALRRLGAPVPEIELTFA